MFCFFLYINIIVKPKYKSLANREFCVNRKKKPLPVLFELGTKTEMKIYEKKNIEDNCYIFKYIYLI